MSPAAPLTPESRAHRAAAEDWFVARGLPYFVDEVRESVRRSLAPVRIAALSAVALLVAVGVGAGVLQWSGDLSSAVLAGLVAASVPLALYAVSSLHAAPLARWTIARTFSSLGLLLPLVTRALPLLLLFITFLFINTEVWQVASSLDEGVLWVAVLLFAGVAVAFLLVRLPEELDEVDDEMAGDLLVASCAGTPLEAEAVRCAAEVSEEITLGHAHITGLAKANLVLVLLISQALQVLLLSLAVYAFFVGFGAVAIRADVIESWLGYPPDPLFDGIPVITHELVRVATFLAAFSGLYFTVYAVSDETYRKQFFSSLIKQLRRAVGVRTVYGCLAPTSRGTET